MKHILDVKDLSITLNGHSILKKLSFHVDSGEIVGFIGDNGSGKSTTMKAIANLIYPAPSTVRISGHDVRQDTGKALHALSAQIEDPIFFENLSGADNLHILAALRNTSFEEILRFVRAYQMETHLKRKTRRYSLGMRKRLALSAVLAATADLYILDEPFSGLDQRGMRTLAEHLDKLREDGKAVLISSHQLTELSRVMNRAIYLEDGCIVDSLKAW